MTDWLFDTLLASTALIALVLLIRKPVARHFGAGIAYALWILPAARLVMPPLTQEIAPPPENAGDTLASALSFEPMSALPVLPAGPTIDWAALLLTLWLGGAALLLIIQTIRYCTTRDSLLADAIAIEQIGSITVIESEDVTGPLAFGLYRRYIAVPKNFSSLFAPRERELALAHELAHHHAGDLFANLAAFLFLCLQWFNPLAWWAWSAFRLDQEAACDARVLAGADAGTRQIYGRALARTTNEGLSSFAMALNSPHNIIERLRRVMMQDPSKGRRLAGRLAICAVAAVALPLTATVVPVFAEDTTKADEGATPDAKVQKRKMIIIKSSDGKPMTVDVKGDEDTPFVKTIEKDGKTIVLRSSKELSEAEIETMVAEADKSRMDAEKSLGDGKKIVVEDDIKGKRIVSKFVTRSKIITKDGDGKAVILMEPSDGPDPSGHHKVITMMAGDLHEHAKMLCNDGQAVNVNELDGKDKAMFVVSICSKGNAKLARAETINGLKEAQKQLKEDKDIPDSVRKNVIDSLQQKIEGLEKDLAQDKDAS